MITHTIESYWIPSQKKTKSSYKFKDIAKISTFWILEQTLHKTHLLKLLDKMCKYKMDPTSIVEDTERTRFCPQTDRRTDGQGETSKQEIHPLSITKTSLRIIFLKFHTNLPGAIEYKIAVSPLHHGSRYCSNLALNYQCAGSAQWAHLCGDMKHLFICSISNQLTVQWMMTAWKRSIIWK